MDKGRRVTKQEQRRWTADLILVGAMSFMRAAFGLLDSRAENEYPPILRFAYGDPRSFLPMSCRVT